VESRDSWRPLAQRERVKRHQRERADERVIEQVIPALDIRSPLRVDLADSGQIPPPQLVRDAARVQEVRQQFDPDEDEQRTDERENPLSASEAAIADQVPHTSEQTRQAKEDR